MSKSWRLSAPTASESRRSRRGWRRWKAAGCRPQPHEIAIAEFWFLGDSWTVLDCPGSARVPAAGDGRALVADVAVSASRRTLITPCWPRRSSGWPSRRRCRRCCSSTGSTRRSRRRATSWQHCRAIRATRWCCARCRSARRAHRRRGGRFCERAWNIARASRATDRDPRRHDRRRARTAWRAPGEPVRIRRLAAGGTYRGPLAGHRRRLWHLRRVLAEGRVVEAFIGSAEHRTASPG